MQDFKTKEGEEADKESKINGSRRAGGGRGRQREQQCKLPWKQKGRGHANPNKRRKRRSAREQEANVTMQVHPKLLLGTPDTMHGHRSALLLRGRRDAAAEGRDSGNESGSQPASKRKQSTTTPG